tara:strand:+ start:298 stop:558 length:261 start_codon:yes stop_codon:yes gene_type:complete
MHIMLFFTYGVSLQKWKETGLFEITNQFSRLVTERVIEAPYVEAAQLNGIGFIGQVDGEGKDVYADCLCLPNLLGLEDTVKKVYAI